MRAKLAGASALGMAAGMLLAGALLWRSGAIQPKPAARNGQASRVSPPSAQMPPNRPPAQGEAQRIGAEDGDSPPRLEMPLAGVNPARLADTFLDERQGRKHEALDIPAPRGTPVHAALEGNVAKLFSSNEGGLTVYEFDNSQTWCVYYAHLDRYAPGLQEGALLRKGDVLGFVGSTGNASAGAPHLHLALFKLGPEKKWWEGIPVNPLPLLE